MKVVKVFNYRSDTCEFIGSSDYQTDENNVITGSCTLIEPPAMKKEFIPIFDIIREKWNQYQDNRGLIVYDKNTTRPAAVTALGVVPDNFTDIEPVFESPGGTVKNG